MVHGVVVVCGARRSRMGRGHLWALDLHEWGVVVVNGGLSVAAQCGCVAVICGWVVRVACRL